MSDVGQLEFFAQRRVVAFFKEALKYDYLGYWKERPDNSKIEETLLTGWLKRQRHSEKIIGKVLFELRKAAALAAARRSTTRTARFMGCSVTV